MADAKLTALTAAGALAAADLFYVSQSAASRKATGTQLLALVGTAYVPLTGGASMAGPLSIVNSTTQQIAYVYNTFTDASNYERLTLTGVAGTSVNIKAETLGTGGDNLDIVLTPAGTGAVQVKSGLIAGASTLESAALAYGGEYGMRMFSSAALRWTAGNIAAGADTAMRRSAAGVVAIDNGTAGTYRDLIARNVRTDPVAFASLVAAATAGNGARAMITNCSHATFGTAADGGGSTKVPVYSDGASWLVG